MDTGNYMANQMDSLIENGEKLLIIKANEIKQIRKSEYNIFKYIMVS